MQPLTVIAATNDAPSIDDSIDWKYNVGYFTDSRVRGEIGLEYKVELNSIYIAGSSA